MKLITLNIDCTEYCRSKLCDGNDWNMLQNLIVHLLKRCYIHSIFAVPVFLRLIGQALVQRQWLILACPKKLVL